MSVIKGTKDAKAFRVISGTKDPINFSGMMDTRKLRCKKCGEQALKSPDGKGGVIYRCPNCGTTYNSTRI